MICLSGSPLTWVESFTYLGFSIATGKQHNDTEEIEKRLRELRIRANMVAARFYNASIDVKRLIFKTYFSQIYCLGLWIPGTAKLNSEAKVTLNNCLQKVFGIKGIDSMSQEFVRNGFLTWGELRRKSMHSLLERVASCPNEIIVSLFNSKTFYIIILL